MYLCEDLSVLICVLPCITLAQLHIGPVGCFNLNLRVLRVCCHHGYSLFSRLIISLLLVSIFAVIPGILWCLYLNAWGQENNCKWSWEELEKDSRYLDNLLGRTGLTKSFLIMHFHLSCLQLAFWIFSPISTLLLKSLFVMQGIYCCCVTF